MLEKFCMCDMYKCVSQNLGILCHPIDIPDKGLLLYWYLTLGVSYLISYKLDRMPRYRSHCSPLVYGCSAFINQSTLYPALTVKSWLSLSSSPKGFSLCGSLSFILLSAHPLLWPQRILPWQRVHSLDPEWKGSSQPSFVHPEWGRDLRKTSVSHPECGGEEPRRRGAVCGPAAQCARTCLCSYGPLRRWPTRYMTSLLMCIYTMLHYAKINSFIVLYDPISTENRLKGKSLLRGCPVLLLESLVPTHLAGCF